MKNNGKMTRRTKDEKRRLAFEKRNVKKEKYFARNGAKSGPVLVMEKATDINRRFIAAFLALVFSISAIIVGVNFATKAEDVDGFNMLEATNDSGLVMRKGIRHNNGGTEDDPSDDTYDLRMEAYATAPLATKDVEENTPLDIVMVLDQSSSMKTPDVLTGGYTAQTDPSFSIDAIKNGEYYYHVVEDGEDHYYPVSVSERDEKVIDSYVLAKENGTVKNTWTAQSADEWRTANDRKNLYYLNNGGFETVYSKKDSWYKNTGTIRADDFFDGKDWFYKTNNADLTQDYFVNSAGDINTTPPFWHRVFENTRGVTFNGFYVYLWYYRDGERTFENGHTLPSANNESQAYKDAIANGTIVRVPNSPYTSGSYAPYDAWTSYMSGREDYTGGQLYYKQSSSSTFNRLYTSLDGGQTESILLAWPLSGNSNASSVQSSTYNGTLYTAGYIPYYTDDNRVKHYIGNAVFSTSEDGYIVANEGNNPLYKKETINRIEAEKLGATQFAGKIANASENVDNRIAVVGFDENGAIKTNLVSATNTEAVNAAINSLQAAADGGSSIAAGLTTAKSAFETLNPADSRKRVVVVFTDDNTADNNALSAAAELKDQYNATVYVIGYPESETGSAMDTFLSHLSSEYFATATNPIVETQNNDGKTYHVYGSNKTTINDAFDAIATEVQTATTKTTLGADNSVLKDIISGSFNVPANPTITVQTATSSYNDDTFEWTTDGSLDDAIDHDWDATNKTLSITGFDYNANYVTEEHSGKKIIVTISGLTLKDGVEADSDRRIYSNTADSGLYKEGAEDLLFAAFPRPYVDKTSDLVPKGNSGIAKDGTVVNKYLTANENGNYDLTLEAYSTSKNETTTTTEKIPTDFVVVVDQSGSMEEADMPTGTATKRNDVNLETVANGAYYYYDESADQYYKVYGVKDYLYRYYPANYWFTGDIVEHLGADIGWFMGETDATTDIDNAFYFREVVGGKPYYLPIKTTIEGKIGTYYMRFSYPSKKTGGTYEFNREDTTYSSNGNSPWYKNVLNGNVMTSGALWATANAAVQGLYPNDNAYTYSTINLGLAKPRTGMYINYPMYGRHLSYTKLCYRDVNGIEHVLPSNQNNGQTTWEFCNNDGQALTTQSGSTRPTYSNLYTFDTNIRRIDALQSALNEFAQAVANEEDDFGPVDNKISIVGFSSPNSTGYYYDNTELLTGSTFDITRGRSIPSNGGYSADGYNHNGKAMSDATAADYAGSLVGATNGTVDTVNAEITDAINALTAYGGTQPENGLNMANNVLTNRSETQYTIRSGDNVGQKVDRNTVVIFFTDGQPGDYHFSDQYAEANQVVEAAKQIKDKGTSIFSIGVFGESDGNPLTYTDKTTNRESETKSWKYLGGWMETYQNGSTYYCLRRQWRPSNDDYTTNANDTIYDYMSVTSSNYPDAKDFIAPAWLSNNFSGNYIAATDGDAVRQKSTAEKTNKYYRMASNQATLVEAFLQAITMNSQAIESDGTLGPTTIMRDILKDGTFKAGTNSSVTVETVKGKADRNGTVTFENERTPISLQTSSGDGHYEVTGFDYTVNSIYYGKPEDTENDLAESQGRKLIVTIKNVVPNETITSGENNDKLFSNEDDSGIVKNNVTIANFPKPAITRHSYTMDVGDANKDATFEVTTKLVANDGASADLSDVILVKPDGSRVPYTEIQDETFTMANGSTFYFENVPQGYSVQTSLKAPDSFFTYSFWTNNDESNKETLSTKDATTSTLGYSDNVLHVTSVSSYRTVTIAESVSGDYANESDVFDVELTLTKPDGDPFDEDTITLADGVVLEKKLNGKYKATITGLPGTQEEKVLKVPANWTLDVDPIDHEKYDVETGYPKYNTQEDSTQVGLPENGVVITSELTNIFINNVAKDIPVTGISNFSSHNWIIYLLVGIAAVAVISGGIFLWKKKDEFVEQ